MRVLHAICPDCLVMRSWHIETILCQVELDCIAQCTCVMCGKREAISFKLPDNKYNPIKGNAYVVEDNEPQPATPKPTI